MLLRENFIGSRTLHRGFCFVFSLDLLMTFDIATINMSFSPGLFLSKECLGIECTFSKQQLCILKFGLLMCSGL